jgi:DNA polymerase-3 subunit beta
MLKIKTNARILRAAARFSTSKDIRYYLNGVSIEATAQQTIVIGTDGHRLAAIAETHSEANHIGGDFINVIIPADSVAMILKLSGAKRGADDPILISRDDGGAWRLETSRGADLSFVPIDGQFPDWRRVFPDGCKADGPMVRIDPKYIADFGEAARDLGKTTSSVIYYSRDAQSSMMIRIDEFPDFVGIVMPIRDNGEAELLRHRPAWSMYTFGKPLRAAA